MKFVYTTLELGIFLSDALECHPEYKSTISQICKYNDYSLGTPNSNMQIMFELANELSRNGGNSIINYFRGKGVEYSEIAHDVAKKIGVSQSIIDNCQNMEELGREILKECNKHYFSNLPPEERKAIDDLINYKLSQEIDDLLIGQCIDKIVIKGVLSPIIVNIAIRRVLPLIATIFGGLIIKILNILLIALIILDFTSPAYRKTIISVILIELLRHQLNVKRLQICTL